MIDRLRPLTVPLLVLTLLGAPSSLAQTPCGPAQLQPLKQPDVLTPDANHVLSTRLVVQRKENPCVPVFDKTSNTWKMQAMTLRTYGYPVKPGSAQLKFATPGPTFSVRRATTPTSNDGDALKILLVNQLPVVPATANPCNPACSSSNPQCCPAPGEPCPSTCANGCPQETFPACFHGDNNTNLHFHGTHVSPQAPQDYVLLDLAPEGTPAGGAHAHAHSRGQTATGSFQYAINPFPSNQAEGTHWYHPHKHGSVALQLLNGMGGALLIEGPFDDWLNGFFKASGGLDEKLLVVQQLDDELNFFEKDPNYATPTPLINGQANPVITMRPGEIQRWRLVNETMQASAQLTIGFETKNPPVLKQIAQDGVQFAPENYGSQPMLTQGTQSLVLSPGNRVDLLVQAPTTPGIHLLTYDVIGQLDPALRQRLEAQRQGLLKNLKVPKEKLVAGALKSVANAFVAAAATVTKPPLLTVNVIGTPKPMTYPTQAQWPPMPPFLSDIQTAEIQGDREILFSMTGVQGKQQNAFFINNKQFDPTCVDETMTLGRAEQWTVQNSSAPKHPFHIHTNPYQIIAMNGKALPAPWVWWDTFPLPSVATTPIDVNAGPIWNNDDAKVKCPKVCTNAAATWNGQWKTTVPGSQSVCGCLTWGSITTRSRFLDFTGEYVIHCHFLGHEDRGMMVAVQTVCPDKPDPLWGTPVPAGTADNCAATLPASPQCMN